MKRFIVTVAVVCLASAGVASRRGAEELIGRERTSGGSTGAGRSHRAQP